MEILGVPLITVDGTPLQVDTRKATALLAYLAVTGETQPRERLAELLWPDAGPDRSRAALRRTLSTLRSAVGDERLACDRLAVTLKLDDAFLDLAESRRIAADLGADADALAAAAALHRDDLLAGFFLRDSVAFEDWLHEATEGCAGSGQRSSTVSRRAWRVPAASTRRSPPLAPGSPSMSCTNPRTGA